jgi:SAM-dependent methyltransferase
LPQDRAKPRGYYEGCNTNLAEAVPEGALAVLDVGCADGRLGELLKELEPRRRVWGVERDPAAAERAAARLDGVFCLDVERDDPDLEPGTLDCILYGDVLEHLRDPGGVLERHRRLLRKGGLVLCSIPNVQHHSIFSAASTRRRRSRSSCSTRATSR